MTLQNTTKTLLFASLIAAMILLVSGMDMAEAARNGNTNYETREKATVVDWNRANNVDSTHPRTGESNSVSTLASSNILYRTCNHEASLDNRCYGWDNNGMSYYSTPSSYKNVDSCGSYTCTDLDYYRYARNLISEDGYGYTFKSASYYACATALGICTSPIGSTSNSGVIHHNNMPTGEQINHITTYKYERQGSTITYIVVDQMLQGYS